MSVILVCRDIPVCRLAVALLEKTLKQADKITTILDLPVAPVQALTAAQSSLDELLRGAGDEPITIPRHLRRPLRLGLAIEFDRLKSLEASQGDLLVPTDGTINQLRHVESLLVALDDQLSLTVAGTA